MSAPPPVIIIGMHRSGTSLVTRALGEFGLFTGDRLGSNNEAAFFQQMNMWMMKVCGAEWDNPRPVGALFEDHEIRDLVQEYLGRMIRSPRLRTYLGLARYLRYRKLANLDFPWGWKDPRNTFTLPLWLHFFPDARVIHIKRHGVDSAQSLVVRRQEALAAARKKMDRASPFSRRFVQRRFRGPKNMAALASPRCRSLETAFALWEEYVGEASRHVAERGDRAIEIRYEDLLASPPDNLARLAAFAGLRPGAQEIARVGRTFENSRASAWRADKQLADFAATVAHRLAAHGFGPDSE